MRPKLDRPELNLPNLEGNETVKEGKAAIIRAIQNGQCVPSADPYWNKADVRGALIAFQGFSCIWCGDLLEITDSTVDHYRPQKMYPWLVFEWPNLFLACKDCNRFKGDEFPLTIEINRAGIDDDIQSECPIIPDPCAVSMEDLFNLVIDFPEFISLSPRSGGLGASFLIKELKINGKARVGLCKRRRKVIDQLFCHLADNKQAEAQALACRYEPHSWFVRAILKNLRPEWLPDERHDISLLTEHLSQTLEELEQNLDYYSEPESPSEDDLGLFNKQWSRPRFALAVLSLYHADKDIIWGFIQGRVSKKSLVQIKKYRSRLQDLNPAPGPQEAT